MRDLALFNVAIDSKLRGYDVVSLNVDDVALGRYAADRASVRQKKTGRPFKFELTESTHQAIDDYLHVTGRKSGEYLFIGRRRTGHITTLQFARLLSHGIADIGLDPHLFGTHSRRFVQVIAGGLEVLRGRINGEEDHKEGQRQDES